MGGFFNVRVFPGEMEAICSSFVDRFPRGEIYDLLTTRPEYLAHE